jgi:tetratricopeptide (TPR) repeat protein
MVRTLNGGICAISLAVIGLCAAPGAARAAPDEAPASTAAGDVGEPEEAGSDEATGAVIESDTEAAQRLFREGEEAYWLGDFDLAVERFEEAYRLSKIPGMLYNVGLAYQRRYDSSRAREDLRRARAVFVNYLEADTAGLIDPRHVEGLIAEIDASLAVAEEAPAEAPTVEESDTSSAAEGPERCVSVDPELLDPPPDTARRDRILGASLLTTGGLLVAGGAVSLTAFSLKGREFAGVLRGIEADQMAAGCGSVDSQYCRDLQESAEITFNNGHKANLLAGAVGGSLLATGAVGVVAGALLYRRGRGGRIGKSEVAVTPTFGGAALVGRF